MIHDVSPRPEWIARLAVEERERDAATASARNAASRDAALVTTQGPRLLESLATIVSNDVARFTEEFPGEPERHMAVDLVADGGFEVRRPAYPTATLNVTPQWKSGVVACRYRFKPSADLPVREDRFLLGIASLGPVGEDAYFKHQSSGEGFASLPALSEYLLTPVFTGRPRIG